MTDDQVEAIVVKTLQSTPKGRTHWSTRSMAKNVGLSHTTIGRIWRTFGLKPHLSNDFRLSNDPLLVEKVRDIVGLYMSPPDSAVVLFLATIEEDVPADREFHVVLDNLSTHKTPAVKRWLLRHMRFHLHFTPTHAFG